jgi:hypothetical protein
MLGVRLPHERFTSWLKPPDGVTVIVELAGVDFETVRLAGLAESVNVPAAVIVTWTALDVDTA